MRRENDASARVLDQLFRRLVQASGHFIKSCAIGISLAETLAVSVEANQKLLAKKIADDLVRHHVHRNRKKAELLQDEFRLELLPWPSGGIRFCHEPHRRAA